MFRKVYLSVALIALVGIPLSIVAQLQESPAREFPSTSHQAPCSKPDIVAAVVPEYVSTGLVQEPGSRPVNFPSVTAEYSSGRLSVGAEGVTLAQVLDAIHIATGAEFEGVPEVQDCVTAELFGSPRQVIKDLLNGSGLGYIILASTENPEGLQRVILSKRAPQDGPHSTRVAQGPAREAMAAPTPRNTESGSEDEGEPVTSNRAARYDSAPQPPPGLAPPDPLTMPAESNHNALTPEQKQEQVGAPGKFLQEMYRLRQQQQPQQPSTPATPAAPPQ